MNTEVLTDYEELSPEAAARVDAVCDGFERAWKAARSGATAPRLAGFLDGCDGPERTILAAELLALERACRQRYGPDAGPDDSASSPIPPWPPAARPLDWPGVPGLEPVEVLGAGGMGVVFRARQVALERDVAVKFLRDAHRAGAGPRERFLQEARAVARLRHPHLVQVYALGELPAAGGAASQPYLVLEYVAGGNLADRLRGTPQPPADAARLVERLADAIHYAHQQGVIHRDLKPANVLLQCSHHASRDEVHHASRDDYTHHSPLTSYQPKISDFGLAKLLTDSGLTHSGDVLGTPSYMAPEQASGRPGPVTAAVDVYGLGAILYETLTGRPPFASATVHATLGLVRQDEPVPPRRLQPTVPPDLETICLKCLRKDPGRRYAAAQELADDLRRFRAGEPIRARPVGVGEWLAGWCRRRPGVAALLAALVLAIGVGGAGVLWQWRRASHNAAEAEANAAAFRRQRDTALQEGKRAARHLELVYARVDRLEQLGRDLRRKPGKFRDGQAVLEEALGFYRDLLPKERNEPKVRRKAARLFGHAAGIHHTLGHADRAADAFGRQADLLAGLREENPTDQRLRIELADSHRWRGNALRDLGKIPEARAAYEKAAALHEELLREAPDDPNYRMALANTLLNTATLLSCRSDAAALEPLYRRAVELDRGAVRARPWDPALNAELALALENQGLYFLATGRGAEAEAAVREALAIYKWVHATGAFKGSTERYLARNFGSLGRVLAARGQAPEAEKSYQKAETILQGLIENMPESALYRAELADVLTGQADLLKKLGRPQEAAQVRRRLIRDYEALKPECRACRHHPYRVAVNYLELMHLLCELGRPKEAVEPCRKAVALAAEDPSAANDIAWFLATTPEPSLRDTSLAVRLAKKAVEGRPRCANCRNTLGVALYCNGEPRAAVAELETAMHLRSGGDAFDWFFLAMAHRRLGDRATARACFGRAVQWMERHNPHDDELRRFRAEAAAALGGAGT
jgi:tetratricopeptide (TPR) repeat protein